MPRKGSDSPGIVVTVDKVVYDFETTSGGPVPVLNGAVNAAILVDFDGSNLGVPAAEARQFLDETLARRDVP